LSDRLSRGEGRAPARLPRLRRRTRCRWTRDARFYFPPAGPRERCFPPAHRQRAQAAKRRSGFWPGDLAIGKKRIETDRQTNMRERAGPLRRIASATVTRMDDAGVIFCFFEMRDESFKILNRHPARRAAAGHAARSAACRPSFIHARLEPRRKVTGARRVRRHRQSPHCR